MIKYHGNLHIEYLPFDHQLLLDSPETLSKLAKFYCGIWMYDPNFGEFKVCPVCEKYFNQELCQTIDSCSGRDVPHPTTKLVTAWDPINVSQDILKETKEYGDNYYGIIAIDSGTKEIVGFTWGYLEPIEKIAARWGANIAGQLGNSDSTYFSEVAVDPSNEYRGQGIGKELCSLLTMWMTSAHPEVPSFLRTHQTSFARKMFEDVGYRFFASDPQHGDGRIMMMVSQGKNLTP